MHRFFVPPDCIQGRDVVLPADVARRLARVLRARPGDAIVLLDDSGWERVVTLTDVGPNGARGVAAERRVGGGEPSVRIVLYQGLLKSDRFAFALQKGVELGVSRFVPMSCARSVARGDSETRRARWQKIIVEAAEQSGRARIPTLAAQTDFERACDGREGLAVIPWEEERGAGLRSALRRWRAEGQELSTLSVFVGPEGGFTRAEVEHARACGIVPVSLGARILRAETAGIAAAAAILYETGELGA